MNNTTTEIVCAYTSQSISFQFYTYIWAYYIMGPIHFIFGFSIHVVCLIVLYRNSKKKTPYRYQIYIISAETVETLLFNFYCLSFQWCRDTDFFPSCSENYYIIWYATHLSFQSLNGLITIRLLLAVSMSADRLFRLVYPIKYKKIDHKFHQRSALVISLIIGLSTSIYSCFEGKVAFDPNLEIYFFTQDKIFILTPIARSLSVVRDLVRFFGFLILVVCNLLLIKFHRSYLKSIISMIITNEEMQAKDKLTTTLAVSQSFLTFIDISLSISYYLVKHFAPAFFACWGVLANYIFDGGLMMTSTINLYLLLYVSKPFRDMFRKELGWKCVGSGVGPVIINENVMNYRNFMVKSVGIDCEETKF